MDSAPLNSGYIVSTEIPLGGIDKEETLSDGTKLIYISHKNIRKKYEEYRKQAIEIFKKIPFVDEVESSVLSALETSVICILAGLLLGWYIGDYKTALAGGIVLSIPKIYRAWNLCYRAKRFSFEFGDLDKGDITQRFFYKYGFGTGKLDDLTRFVCEMQFYRGGKCFTIIGNKSKNIGVAGVAARLNGFAEINKQCTGDSRYGVVVVVRPKSKLMVEPQGVFQSGVFPAREFNKAELLKCIEKKC